MGSLELYWGMAVWLHLALTTGLDSREWSAPRSGRLSPFSEHTQYLFNSGLWTQSRSRYFEEDRNISWLFRQSNQPPGIL